MPLTTRHGPALKTLASIAYLVQEGYGKKKNFFSLSVCFNSIYSCLYKRISEYKI